MDEAVRRACALGIDRVELVATKNSIPFYKKMGWIPVAAFFKSCRSEDGNDSGG